VGSPSRLRIQPDFTREKSVDQLKSSQAPPYWDRESMRRRNCRSGAILANKKHFAFTHPSRKVGQHHEVLHRVFLLPCYLQILKMWMMKNETDSPLRECIAEVAPKLPSRSVRIQPSWKWDNTKCSNVDWVLLAAKTLPNSNVSTPLFRRKFLPSNVTHQMSANATTSWLCDLKLKSDNWSSSHWQPESTAICQRALQHDNIAFMGWCKL